MNNHFDVDLNDPESTKAIFSISDFIGYACRNVGKYWLLLDPVVRKVNSAYYSGQLLHKGIKAMTPGILNSQGIKSVCNSKMLKFNVGFTCY